ncbi:MAG TPA: Ig-like domain-containing protein [Kofleriaceae bacterium]|nr:Ig-like domain-containing protein [Kofleriaceae bacterium]
MFVNRSRLKTQGAVVSTLALLTLAACEDPTASTDLRPEGDPEVLAVLVMNDPGLFLETATFCKQGDAKRPGFVGVPVAQICDEDLNNPAGFRETDPDTNVETFVPAIVEDAVPTGWYVRVMFDELLDPDIEELVPVLDPDTMQETGTFTGSLLNTQPFTLTCNGANVAYDGWYSPSGNNVTWPVGPSLVAFPVDYSTVPTSGECTVQIKSNVVDKDGNTVPADQQGTASQYKWKIAALAVDAIAPAPADPGAEETIAVDAPLIVTFNAFIDAATLAANEVEIHEGAAGVTDCAAVSANATTKAAVIAPDADGLSIDVTIAGGWVSGRMYSVTFLPNEVADVAGGPGSIDEVTVCFLAE